MGLRHGDDVPVTAGRLCVPVDDAAESWVAVTAQGDLHACRITTEAWPDHYVAVTSGEVTDFVGRLDDALPTPRPTDAERRELIAFLRSLGSDYASEWTREPGAGPR